MNGRSFILTYLQIFSLLTILLINLLTIEHAIPHNKNLIAMQVLVNKIDLEILSLLLQT